MLSQPGATLAEQMRKVKATNPQHFGQNIYFLYRMMFHVKIRHDKNVKKFVVQKRKFLVGGSINQLIKGLIRTDFDDPRLYLVCFRQGDDSRV